jgi:uncharacterized protein (TIGR02453 family)
MAARINLSTLDFLSSLKRNNRRTWFNQHKTEYLHAMANVEQFMDALIAEMNKHDQLDSISGKKSLYKIYNDLRFDPKKSPYNPCFPAYLRRAKPMLRGGYYVWIEPGRSRVTCGFSSPSPDDLYRVRLDIDRNFDEWTRILTLPKIKTTFGKIRGRGVATAPRGFPKDHPAIELLRLQQYLFSRSFTDNEVLSPRFLSKVNKTFKAIRPYFDYMTEVLSTDLNGLPRGQEKSAW